ncbi:MAG: bifunctional precorrin-2 dehydrogenase/sirohydrochlorin ferrochelatase [Methanocalculus sp.]|uniref:precorrin-2 dehydrogenase/sirohydrochlorin ferrochelatase family protein n=1 Tax=Methanocalculus sp. TaxID=2004547 RepID=UPI002723408E|nr:bifunctional precorrin-2 dehydrogenase/sirohydrochlorin ferrochelatase [Methanocalculus sp.]MDO8842090.1 bifunctional precorrin-2 dehydrogenase/sirohydrochlorin ferrochelatase [Methanocalculus sp.]MDO9538768.1 bifunctional precorrin-2 dehydrogenase/sirohydrochlorin ferrochelatase [Methanocalculus sp.]
MIPLIINFSRKNVIIFGGGSVSARKARYFHEEAEVTIISRSFSDACIDLSTRKIRADTLKLSDREIKTLISGAFLVIAATSDKNQNDRIGRLAEESAILFNNADGEAGDVIIPSVVRGRNLLIGFSTGGGSPAVSRYLREQFETTVPEIDAMVDLQRILREALKSTALPQEERARRLREAIEDPEIREGLMNNREGTIQLALSRFCHE